MIVELIGCAGAGKTTLAKELCALPHADRRVVAMPNLVLGQPLLRHVTHVTAVNVAQEVGGLPSFLRALPAEHEFLGLARRLLARPTVSRFDRLNGMRGIVRKLGMYHRARRIAAEDVVLCDEGTLLSAYNLFVTPRVPFGRDDIEAFLRCVPLPDLVVHVRAPVDTLVERASARPTPRRQHRGRPSPEVERDVRETVRLFELVASCVGRGVLDVDGSDGLSTLQRRAQEVAAWIDASVPAEATGEGTPYLVGRPEVGT